MTATRETESAELGKEINLNEKLSKESLAADGASEHDISDPSSPTDEEKATPPAQKDAPEPPPNGGTKAWLQVLGAWMLFFNTWGILK